MMSREIWNFKGSTWDFLSLQRELSIEFLFLPQAAPQSCRKNPPGWVSEPKVQENSLWIEKPKAPPFLLQHVSTFWFMPAHNIPYQLYTPGPFPGLVKPFFHAHNKTKFPRGHSHTCTATAGKSFQQENPTFQEISSTAPIPLGFPATAKSGAVSITQNPAWSCPTLPATSPALELFTIQQKREKSSLPPSFPFGMATREKTGRKQRLASQ